jgi:phage terminase small subunit
MTPKQQRFVQEYLVDLNATQAAIRAGYSEKTAYEIGHENLRKPEIQTALEEARDARSKRVEIDQDWVLNRLASVAERCLQNEPVSDRDGNPIYVDTPTGRRAAAYAFNPTGATRALELLGRHLGLFEHRVAVRHDVRPALSDLRTEEIIARLQMLRDRRVIDGQATAVVPRAVVPIGSRFGRN